MVAGIPRSACARTHHRVWPAGRVDQRLFSIQMYTQMGATDMSEESNLSRGSSPHSAEPFTAKRISLNDAPWRTILTPAFMQQNTPFLNLEELIAHCATMSGEETASMIECELLDALIREQTRFAGLHDFLRSALYDWARQETEM